MEVNNIMNPENLKYTKSHEWVKLEGEIATIGITDYAQHELTDIVFVDLPAVGKKIDKGGEFGVVESVKTASDIYSPVSGEVTEINKQLENKPELVNQDPFGKGWMIKIKCSNPKEADALLDAKTYSQLTVA